MAASAQEVKNRFKPKFPPGSACPITNQVMLVPVIAADGQTYEQEAIEEWLSTHNTSPVTNAPLPNKTLILNQALKGIIDFVLQSNLELWAEIYFSEKLQNSLLQAVKAKNKVEIDLIISKDPRLLTRVLVDNKSGQQMTLLAWVCNYGSSESLQFLLNRLGDEFATIKEIKEGHEVELLNAAAINLDSDGAMALGYKLSWQATKYRTGLNKLIAEGSSQALKIAGVYLAINPMLLEMSDDAGQTPLHIAAQLGQLNFIEYFLQSGANAKTHNAQAQRATDVARAAGKLYVAKFIEEKRMAIKIAPITRLLQVELEQQRQLIQQQAVQIEQLKKEQQKNVFIQQTQEMGQRRQQAEVTKLLEDEQVEVKKHEVCLQWHDRLFEHVKQLTARWAPLLLSLDQEAASRAHAGVEAEWRKYAHVVTRYTATGSVAEWDPPMPQRQALGGFAAWPSMPQPVRSQHDELATQLAQSAGVKKVGPKP